MWAWSQLTSIMANQGGSLSDKAHLHWEVGAWRLPYRAGSLQDVGSDEVKVTEGQSGTKDENASPALVFISVRLCGFFFDMGGG